jgi:photoactive yellow protein
MTSRLMASRARVVIVEDDAGLLEALSFLLEGKQFDVTSTQSGLKGLQVIAEQRPDLVVLDIDVEDLSGLGVARAMRDFGHSPLIIMSGRDGPWQTEALEHGAVACLPKPFDQGALEDAIEATLAATAEPAPWPGDVRVLAPTDLEKVTHLSPSELDALPFGAIRLDAEGRVVSFNAYEQRQAALQASAVMGRRFSEVAPCTQVREFVRAVEEGRANGQLDTVLRFVFPRHGALSVVSVRLYLDPPSGQLWLLISQRPGAPESWH